MESRLPCDLGACIESILEAESHLSRVRQTLGVLAADVGDAGTADRSRLGAAMDVSGVNASEGRLHDSSTSPEKGICDAPAHPSQLHGTCTTSENGGKSNGCGQTGDAAAADICEPLCNGNLAKEKLPVRRPPPIDVPAAPGKLARGVSFASSTNGQASPFYSSFSSSIAARGDGSLREAGRGSTTKSDLSPTWTNVTEKTIDLTGDDSDFIADQVVIDNSHLRRKSRPPGPSLAELYGQVRKNRGLERASNGRTAQRDNQGSLDFEWQRCCWCLWFPVVHPEARFRLYWLIFGFVFILYESISLPMTLAFSLHPEGIWFVFASIINVYFILDVPLAFRTGYVNDEGQVVMQQGLVAWKYVRSWLCLDVIASIPWEWFSETRDWKDLTRGSKGLRFFRVARMIRLVRLLRLMKLKALIEYAETFIEANQLLVFVAGVTKVFASMCAITHWGACLWYAVGTQVKSEKTWIKEYLAEYHEVEEHYFFSLYFTLTTMTTVGYGDMGPTNYEECLFTLVLLVVACVVFASLMGVLTELISSLNRHNRARLERKTTLSRYMRWRALPRKLRMRIRHYLLFVWDTKETYEAYEEDIKKQLTPVLKSELAFHIYGKTLSLAPFFMWMRDYPICLKHLTCMVTSAFLDHGDFLFCIGDPLVQIFMLLSGKVWLSRNHKVTDNSEAPLEIRQLDASKTLTELSPKSRRLGRKSPLKRLETSRLQLPRHQSKSSAQTVKEVISSGSEMIRSSVTPRRGSKEKKFGRQISPGTRKSMVVDTGHSHFDSEVLKRAYKKVRTQDTSLNKAAVQLQRAWRKRKTNPGKSPSKQLVAHFSSRTVRAPAYFGESCLWVPHDKWKEPPMAYTYMAKCTDRGETLTIPRDAVDVVITTFSPWLRDRFECFREAVVEGLKRQLTGDGLEDDIFQMPSLDEVDQEGTAQPPGDFKAEVQPLQFNQAASLASCEGIPGMLDTT